LAVFGRSITEETLGMKLWAERRLSSLATTLIFWQPSDSSKSDVPVEFPQFLDDDAITGAIDGKFLHMYESSDLAPTVILRAGALLALLLFLRLQTL
jgi:hypothetical protein